MKIAIVGYRSDRCGARGEDRRVGYDLRQAVLGALRLDPADCVAYARQHSWRNWTEQSVPLLEPFEGKRCG